MSDERQLPDDGTEVTATTFANPETDSPTRDVRGPLTVRRLPAYVQCLVGDTLVDPDTIKPVPSVVAAREPVTVKAKDAAGHEHRGKGPGGGQFTSSGGGETEKPVAGKKRADKNAPMKKPSKDGVVADGYAPKGTVSLESEFLTGTSRDGSVYRVQPKGSDLHGQKSEASNGDELAGVFVFDSLNELAAIDWMNEENVELVKIRINDGDLFETSDQEGTGLKTGRGTIVARLPFDDVRGVRRWAVDAQRRNWQPVS